jgi:hypothetical protein
MKFHFEIVGKAKSVISRLQDSIRAAHTVDASPTAVAHRIADDVKSADDLKSTLSIMLHCADINNVAKPWTLSKKWSDLVTSEFYLQGDLEKAQKMPASPFMDRDTGNQAQMTINFIDFIAAPLQRVLYERFPDYELMYQAMLDVRER